MPDAHFNPDQPAKPGIPAQDRWKNQIRQLLARGDFNDAKALAQKACAEFPDDPEFPELEDQAIHGRQRSVQAYQWMEEGKQFCEEQNFEEGLHLLRSAYTLEERLPAIRTALLDALLCAAGGAVESDLGSAEALAKEAVLLDPASPVVRSVVQSIQEEKQARRSRPPASEAPKVATAHPPQPKTPHQHPEASQTVTETAKAVPAPKAVASNPVPAANRTTASMTPGKTPQESPQKSKSAPEAHSGKVAPLGPEKKVPPTASVEAAKSVRPPVAAAKVEAKPVPPKAPPPPLSAQVPADPSAEAEVPDRPVRPAAARARKAAVPTWVWAVVGVAVLAVCGVLVRKSIGPASLIPVEIRTVPPGASVRIDGELRGVTGEVSLPPGSYRIEALLDGYQPAVQDVDITPQFRGPIELTLLPVVPGLHLSTDLARGSVLMDGQPVGELQDGQFAMDALEPGNHTLQIRSGTAEAEIPFEVVPAGPPVLTGAISSKNLRVILVSYQESRGEAYASFGPVSLTLDGQPAGEVPKAGGLELAGLSGASHEFVFGEGRRQQKIAFEANPAGGLFVALSSDRNVGSLEIVSNEEGFAVILNGKPRKVTAQRGRYYLRNIDARPVTLQVVKDGFRSDPPEQKIAVRKGETTKVTFDLTAIPTTGSLRLAGLLPDTSVSLDGAPYEVGLDGALTATLNEGEHRVELTRPGYRPKSLRAPVKAGETVTLSGSEVLVNDPIIGRLALASRSPASAKVVLRGNGPEIPVPGQDAEAPEGDYTLVATAPGYQEFSKSVRITEGAPVSVEVNLPLIAQPVGMEGWDDPAAWKLENGWYNRKGGMFSLFRPSSESGTFQFTARHKGRQLGLFGGGHIQWVVHYVDAQNYDLYQIDREKLSWRRVVNGNPGPEKNAPHQINIKDDTYYLELQFYRGKFSGKIFDGQTWKAFPRLEDDGPRPTDGRFGLFLPSNEEVWVTGVAFKPRE